MSTIAEIEAAIEKLPEAQVEELVAWLEATRARRATPPRRGSLAGKGLWFCFARRNHRKYYGPHAR